MEEDNIKKIKIIRFNDDNHAERIWANGKNFLSICNNKKYEDIESYSIWVCDDFEDYEEDDELIDDIWEWFNSVELMTEEQIELVQKKKWKELRKTIF